MLLRLLSAWRYLFRILELWTILFHPLIGSLVASNKAADVTTQAPDMKGDFYRISSYFRWWYWRKNAGFAAIFGLLLHILFCFAWHFQQPFIIIPISELVTAPLWKMGSSVKSLYYKLSSIDLCNQTKMQWRKFSNRKSQIGTKPQVCKKKKDSSPFFTVIWKSVTFERFEPFLQEKEIQNISFRGL